MHLLTTHSLTMSLSCIGFASCARCVSGKVKRTFCEVKPCLSDNDLEIRRPRCRPVRSAWMINVTLTLTTTTVTNSVKQEQFWYHDYLMLKQVLPHKFISKEYHIRDPPLAWGLLDQNHDIESAVHRPLNHGTTGNKRIL